MVCLLPTHLGGKWEAEAALLATSWSLTMPPSLSPQPSDSSPSSSSTPASGCSSPNDSEQGPNPVLGSEVRPCWLDSLGVSSEAQPSSQQVVLTRPQGLGSPARGSWVFWGRHAYGVGVEVWDQ